MSKILWIAFAGAIGTLARCGLAPAVHRLVGNAFPWGTLVVNTFCCFAVGIVWTIADGRFAIGGDAKLVLLTGLLGAFGTISAIELDSARMLQTGAWWMAAVNLVAQNLVGLLAIFAGFAAGKRF